MKHIQTKIVSVIEVPLIQRPIKNVVSKLEVLRPGRGHTAKLLMKNVPQIYQQPDL